VLWRDGRLVGLDDGPDATIATDVNGSGVAVGQRVPSGGTVRLPVMWRSPGMTVALALPAGARGGIARAINDAGLIVGLVFVDATTAHAAVWSADHPDQVTDLGTGGAASAQLSGVSETGVLVGQTRTIPFVALTGTVAGGLRPLAGGAPGSATAAIAAAGRYVVGTETPIDCATETVRWDAGTGRVLDRLAFPNAGVTPTAVNRRGQVTAGNLVWSPPGQTWLAPSSDGPTASAISDDGRVGGRATASGRQVATIWTCVPAHGPLRPRAH
jgi:uncharacterized membrane protein